MQSSSSTGYYDLVLMLGWLRHVLAIFFYGGMGGLAYAAATLLDGGKSAPGSNPQGPKDWVALKGSPMRGYFCGQVLIGIGGAMAAIFAILTIGKAVGNGTTDDELSLLYSRHLYLYSMCFVAGFISNRLLPAIGRNLQEQLEKVKDKQKQTEDKVEQVKDKQQQTEAKVASSMEESRKFSTLMLDVMNARDEANRLANLNQRNRERPTGQAPMPVDTSQAEKYILTLEGYRPDFGTNRPLHIVLANLYLETGKREKGSEILRQFIKNREDAKQTNDDDVASAWFNLACYSCIGSQEAKGEEKTRLLQEAAEYLENCLTTARNGGAELLAIHRTRAIHDEDLQPLREAGILDKIVSQFK